MFKEQVALASYTTLKVGGPAEYFAEVASEEELAVVVAEAKKMKLNITVLGGGSNILVSDQGIAGLVVHNCTIGTVEKKEGTDVYVTAGAGIVFDELVAKTVEKEYWGLENLSHIPGSVGATPVQNVGAYGREVKDLITEVRVFNTETEAFEVFTNKDCGFGYRDSFFKTEKGKKYIVTSVTYRLSVLPQRNIAYKDLAAFFGEGAEPTIKEIRDAVISIRSKKFPDWQRVGTAGSFFKNPIIANSHYEELKKRYKDMPGFLLATGEVKVPLGWILDKVCSVRGLTIGNVGSYEGQALVLVHNGDATANEIKNFADEIARRVYDATQIAIEWEVTKAG